jgi:hypothetical protein
MPKAPDLRALRAAAAPAKASIQPAPRRRPEPVEPARPPSRAGKRNVTGYFQPEVARQLRQLALDRDVTIQMLLGEALNDLFAKHGKPELA